MEAKRLAIPWNTLPPLTETQETYLKALAARPQGEIDYSGIPALPKTSSSTLGDTCSIGPSSQITARVDDHWILT